MQLEAKKKAVWSTQTTEHGRRRVLSGGPRLWQRLCIALGLGAAGAPSGETHCLPWDFGCPGGGRRLPGSHACCNRRRELGVFWLCRGADCLAEACPVPRRMGSPKIGCSDEEMRSRAVCWVLLGGDFPKTRCPASITMQLHLLRAWRLVVWRGTLGFHGGGAGSGCGRLVAQRVGTPKKTLPHFLCFLPP